MPPTQTCPNRNAAIVFRWSESAIAAAIGVLLILYWVSDLFVAPADDGVSDEPPVVTQPQTNEGVEDNTAITPEANDG